MSANDKDIILRITKEDYSALEKFGKGDAYTGLRLLRNSNTRFKVSDIDRLNHAENYITKRVRYQEGEKIALGDLFWMYEEEPGAHLGKFKFRELLVMHGYDVRAGG